MKSKPKSDPLATVRTLVTHINSVVTCPGSAVAIDIPANSMGGSMSDPEWYTLCMKSMDAARYLLDNSIMSPYNGDAFGEVYRCLIHLITHSKCQPIAVALARAKEKRMPYAVVLSLAVCLLDPKANAVTRKHLNFLAEVLAIGEQIETAATRNKNLVLHLVDKFRDRCILVDRMLHRAGASKTSKEQLASVLHTLATRVEPAAVSVISSVYKGMRPTAYVGMVSHMPAELRIAYPDTKSFMKLFEKHRK